MCKVLLIAGIKKEKLGKVQKLIKAVTKEMYKMEEDGVGYAAITSKGEIYGEKWTNKDDAFTVRTTRKPDANIEYMEELFGAAAKFKTEPARKPTYGTFGDLKLAGDTRAIIVHARKATIGSKCLENTHPFVMSGQEGVPDTALIHNGSIMNHETLTKTMSTCDSETILHEYLDYALYYNPANIETVAKRLRGEYAVGVLTSILFEDGTKQPILDIFKSNKDLFSGYVPEIDAIVFCTSEFSLENGAKEAGMTVRNIMQINDGYLIRLDAVTGQRCDDLMKFELSERYSYSGYHGNTNHNAARTHVNVRTMNPPPKVQEETLRDAKKNFETNHKDIFSKPYYNVQDSLNDDEKAYYAEIAKNHSTDTQHRALALVDAVIANLA